MNSIKKSIAVILCAAMIVGLMPAESGAKMRKLKLSPSNITIGAGTIYKVKVKKAVKKTKVKWKTNKKSVVKIIKKKSKGKKAYAKIYGVKAGKAKITAIYKVGRKKKKLRCNVTVTDVSVMATDMPNMTDSPKVTDVPVISTEAPTATSPAVSTEAPTATPPAVSTEAPTATPPAASTEAPTATPPAASTKAPTATPPAVSTKAPTATPPAASTKAPTATPPAATPPAASTTAPTATPPAATPTAKPVPTPGTYKEEIDIRGAKTLYNEGKVVANADGSVTGTNVKGILIPLETGIDSGDSVKITVYGQCEDGMRMWLSDSEAKRWSDEQKPMKFGQEYTLVSDDSIQKESAESTASSSDHIQIKVLEWNSDPFKSITITKVVIERKNVEPKPTAEPGWVTTWGTAEEKCDITSDAMPKLTLNGSTVRQIIKVTTAGQKIKLRLSNQYGRSDVQIKSLHIAKQVQADKSDIDTSTDTVVTVDGKEEFTIPKGKVITTDAVSFNVNALENIAISAYFGQTPSNNITGHRGARATTYQVSGNHVSDKALTSYQTTTSWFFLADVSLWTPEGGRAVVCFGDSITDGYGTDAGYLGRKPDSYTRWGDYFAKRLQANEKTKNVAVINEGIGSNSILGSYPTDAGKDRFARDLLQHDSVAYCIILFGVNDLDKLGDTGKYNQLLPEYQKMVKLCHDNGIKVYGAPILPFGTSSYYSDASEKVRTMINNWMRSSDSQMDGIIDFESAVADPSNPKNILEKYTHSDGLHPYDGYDVMAGAIDLKMFE